MGALAVDMQMDFWTPQGLRDATGGGERTLEEYILGAWEELTAHRIVDCPMCGAEMAPAVAHGGAGCPRCGTELS